METPKSENLLVRELQNEIVLMQQLIETQSKILGLKEVQIYDKQAKIDQLEADRKDLFWRFDRQN
ncbi:MAG: hypothetical protein R2822_22590 [Spirosomataceae bacterium]